MADIQISTKFDADGSIVSSPASPSVGQSYTIKVGVLATDAQHGNRGRGGLHTNATTGEAGFMSAADKTALNGAVSDIGDLESDVAALESDVDDLEVDVADHETRIGDLETDAADFEDRISDLEAAPGGGVELGPASETATGNTYAGEPTYRRRFTGTTGGNATDTVLVASGVSTFLVACGGRIRDAMPPSLFASAGHIFQLYRKGDGSINIYVEGLFAANTYDVWVEYTKTGSF